MPRLLLVLVSLAAACSGGSPHPSAEARTSAPARVFVDRMIGALERADADAWSHLLSARIRGRFGADQAALHDHLAVWRRDVLPLAGQLRSAELAVVTSGGHATLRYALDGVPRELALVAVENGALHLDEL